MKHFIKLAFWFGVGYLAVTKAAPYVQAKVESADLDRMWEIWAEGEQ